MRNLLILALLVAPGNQAFAQGSWFTLPNAPYSPHKFADCFFLNPSIGWVVEVEGQIYKTADGGESWRLLLNGRTEFGIAGFSCIAFVNEQLGWAGNQNYVNPRPQQALFETRDGGKTWINISGRITGAPTEGLNALWVIDTLTVYGAGIWYAPPYFIKTTDGGKTWTSVNLSPFIDGIKDLLFFNPDTGLVVGARDINRTLPGLYASKPAILLTTDGGKTWDARFTSTESGKWCYKISFPSRRIGYVSVQGPAFDGKAVLKSTDGGLTWKEKFVVDELPYAAMGFINDKRGWISTEHDTTYETTDAGETWFLVDLGKHIDRFRFFGDTLGYAAGETVYKFVRHPVVGIFSREGKTSSKFSLDQNYPNPFNAETILHYELPHHGTVALDIYDVLGQKVMTLVNKAQTLGSHAAKWDGRDASGKALPSGIYICQLRLNETAILFRKMLMIK